jgi:TolC family type I secretion outer membrane protein
MKRFYPLFLLALLAGNSAFAQDDSTPLVAGHACEKSALSSPLTLADAIQQAFCQNPQTRQWWATVGSQQAQLLEADAAYWPQLSAQYQVNKNWSQTSSTSSDSTPHSLSLSASYLLYDFGGRDSAARLAEAQLQAAIATQDNDLNQLAYSVAQAYLDALLAQESLKAARISEASTLESLKAAEAQLSVGQAILATKLQAQTAYSQAQLARVKAEGTRLTSHATLANLMGMSPDKPFDLASWHIEGLPRQAMVVKQLMDESVASRQDLRAAQEQVKAAQATVDSARAQGRPTLSLGASASRQDGTLGYPPTNSQSIGLTLSAPIFTGFKDTYRIRAAEASLAGARAQEADLANQIRLSVWTAYQNYQTNTEALTSAHDAVVSGEANEQLQLGRFKAGVGTMLDVLSAQASAATARQQQASAEHDYLLSKFTLAQALGRLTSAPLPSIGAQ